MPVLTVNNTPILAPDRLWEVVVPFGRLVLRRSLDRLVWSNKSLSRVPGDECFRATLPRLDFHLFSRVLDQVSPDVHSAPGVIPIVTGLTGDHYIRHP
jgi:hypothetical protein